MTIEKVSQTSSKNFVFQHSLLSYKTSIKSIRKKVSENGKEIPPKTNDSLGIKATVGLC